MTKPFRLAILNSHPIQYFAPLYMRLAQHPDIDLMVYYGSEVGVQGFKDPGFGQSIKWDIPLLEGYANKFLPNLRRKDTLSGFYSLINPAIIHELRVGHFDALWVNGHSYFTIVLAIVAAKLLGIPVLMRCETHLGLPRSSFKKFLRKPLMSVLYQQFCAACLPIGSRNADFYRYHGVTDERLFLVPYTVNNDFFTRAVEQHRADVSALRNAYQLAEALPTILYVSKLSAHKRPLDALQAFQRVVPEGCAAQLVFVGAGHEEQNLRDYATQHDLQNVHFLGFRNQTELPKLYALADIFVFPSGNEPWGLVVNEAMCASLPIIATDVVGCAADLVKDGQNGFQYQPGDITHLAQHLRLLIQDSPLRDQMGRASRDIIESWNFDRCVQGVVDALHYLRR